MADWRHVIWPVKNRLLKQFTNLEKQWNENEDNNECVHQQIIFITMTRVKSNSVLQHLKFHLKIRNSSINFIIFMYSSLRLIRNVKNGYKKQD